MGAELVRAVCAIRRDELRRWQEADGNWNLESVSDWELSEYLPFF